MESDYATQYEELYRSHWWWQSRTELLWKTLRSVSLSPQGHLLDVGCGAGVSFELLEQFGTVQGIEVDASLIEAANRYRDRIYCGALDEQFEPQQFFSLITMLDVLEHMADPQLALTHAARLLEADGQVLITVPAMPMLWTQHDVLNHHYTRYTRSSLQNLVESSGLQVQRMHYFFHWLTPLKLAVRFKEAIVAAEPSLPAIPAPKINGLFRGISRCEQRLFSRFHLPFGSSLLCVARVTE